MIWTNTLFDFIPHTLLAHFVVHTTISECICLPCLFLSRHSAYHHLSHTSNKPPSLNSYHILLSHLMLHPPHPLVPLISLHFTHHAPEATF